MVDWAFWITLVFAVAKWGSIILFTLFWGWIMFWLGREAIKAHREVKQCKEYDK